MVYKLNNLNKFSIVLILIAVVFEIINFIHNYFSYPDIDKFWAYSLIACCIIGVSFLFDRMKKLEWKLDSLEDNLQERFESKERLFR